MKTRSSVQLDSTLLRGQLIPVEKICAELPGEWSCAYQALMNLYVWAGVEPPALSLLRAHISGIKGEAFADCSPRETVEAATIGGLNIFDQYGLLATFGFPSYFGLYTTPPHLTAKEVFPEWLSLGFGPLFFLRVRGWRSDLGALGCGVVLAG